MKIKNIKTAHFVFVGLIMLSLGFFVLADENLSGNQNIFLDSDQDGLSNEEEKAYGTSPYKKDTDGDGYSDGAEVKSGYNPLKPAPGDKLIAEIAQEKTVKAPLQNVTAVSDKNIPSQDDLESGDKTEKENLTQELSAKLANALKDGKNINLEEIDGIVKGTIEKQISFDDLPEVDQSKIKIKKQDYKKLSEEERKLKEKEDTGKYLTAVGYIMVNNSPKKVTNQDDLSGLSKEFTSQANSLFSSFSGLGYFSDLAGRGQDIVDQLYLVEVPEALVPLHAKGMKLGNYAISLKDKINPNPLDPISSIVGFSEVSSFLVLASAFSQEFEQELLKQGITEIPITL